MIARVPGPVLIVDDDAPFLSLAARILHNLGIANIVTAEDAATALRTANATKPTAALVDIGLPDRNGIDLAHELARLPWHPRIVLTSTDRDAISAITSDHRTPLPFIPKDDLATAPLHKMLIPSQAPTSVNPDGE
jgi:DNA-binding NarL/FixJ family response regulator